MLMWSHTTAAREVIMSIVVRAAIVVAVLGLSTATLPADEIKSARIEGTVRNAAGKKVAGATVLINRTTDALPVDGLSKSTTNAEGDYSLELRYRGETPIVVREIWVEAKGFVRAQEMNAHRLKDGAVERVEFKLIPGEVLAGVIDLPSAPARTRARSKLKASDVLDVRSDGFQQFHLAEGGRFELYVPAGVYTIRCLNRPGAEWSGIKSGNGDLRLSLKPVVFDEKTCGELFDRVWSAVDRDYSYFVVKTDVDWNALKMRYRPQAMKATDVEQFIAVLKELLAHLKDMHVWIERSGTTEACYQPPPFERNWSRAATLAELEETGRVNCGFALLGKTKRDGFGYFLMIRQSAADEPGVGKAITAIKA
jgi:hypothetical protein